KPTAKGQAVTYNLSRGQILQFTQADELMGSPIQSNKPIGVWGAHACMFVPVDQGTCDGAHQQIPPVTALGSGYVAVRSGNRYAAVDESPPWRVVGAVAGTMLTCEPSAPAGAPTTLTVGQVAEFRASGPFIVRSQDKDHPFYMAGYMTGCGEPMMLGSSHGI